MEPEKFFFLAVWAEMKSETLSPEKCRSKGVGKYTEVMRRRMPENGAGPCVAMARQAVQLLESHCRLCGRCKIMPHPE